MRISYNWLKDYIDLKIGPERLAELLTMAGLTAEALHRTGDDHIFEIEITSNRPDWLSYVGVARELSAITGNKLKIPLVPKLSSKGAVKVRVDEKTLCPRYTARVMRNVKVGPSPDWLKKKLEAIGLRSVNNIVDITNFCLFETGEPMHAFDLDKLSGGEVLIRKAHKGEKIVTIDGIERTLEGSMLVIADNANPIAIAGVMGGLNTEVTLDTKNILLEAASFEPISVRRTSRSLGVSTDSSYRFERRVDPNNIVYSSGRAASLILEIAGGRTGEFIDIGKKTEGNKPVSLRFSKINSILGIEIAPAKIKKILTALGIKIKASSKDGLKVIGPTFRNDLNAEIDMIEEASRIYGYDKIPGTIPPLVEQNDRMPKSMLVENKAREILTALGANEIITYSLLGKKTLEAAGFSGDAVIEIKNPLSGEQEVMRPSLVMGALNAALYNINRKSKDLKLFEIGNIYARESSTKFIEKKCLAIALAGENSNWLEGSRPAGFFDLKGAIETLLSGLGIGGAIFKHANNGYLSPESCASIEAAGEYIGMAGEVSRKTLGAFDIKDPVYYCELSLDAIMRHAALKKRFGELPKHPSTCRDMSIVVGRDISNAGIEALIEERGRPTLKNAALIDRYAGKQIPAGKVSLTYRLEYWNPSKTLEEKDVSSVHAEILRSLEEKYGAKLR